MKRSMDTGSFDGKGLQVCMLVRNDMLNDPRVARHAEGLGVHDFRVTVVCLASARTVAREMRSSYEILRVKSRILLTTEQLALRIRSRSLLRMIVRLVQIVALQLAFFRTARKVGAHVYCANDLDTLLIGVLAAGSQRKLVYDSHELWTDMLISVPEYLKRILRLYEGLLIKRVDVVMTVNELIGKVIASRYSVASPIEIVYNCPVLKKEQRSTRVARKSRLKTVLYQGRYVPQRGLENIVKAARHLLPDIRLLFRGYGSIEQQLREIAIGAGNVKFVRPVPMERMIDAARDAEVGIVSYVPSNLNNYLASPNKLFEYMHAGLPIAASDIPFMKKVVCENEIGVVFDPRDPEDIARSLNKITRQPALRHYRKMIMAAAEKYSWQNEEKKLLRAYARLGETFRQQKAH
jgi:glycosyltransferase involved in cell wall biosynthesis